MKIKRKFDATEVLHDFFSFYERTGDVPTIHIGTDSQVHKFKSTRVFRFVTVILLHHRSVEPERRLAKTWALVDWERASTFEMIDGKETVMSLFRRPSSTLSVDLSGQKYDLVAEKLNEVAAMMGLSGFDKGELMQPASGKVTGHSVTMRMLSEAARTLAVANSLTGLGPSPIQVHDGNWLSTGDIKIGVDINPDERHLSNQALSAVVGIFEGLGYKNVEWKPNSMITYAADRLSK